MHPATDPDPARRHVTGRIRLGAAPHPYGGYPAGPGLRLAVPHIA